MTKYPTRCEIIDVTGKEVFPGIKGNTPEVSKPYVGQQGTAELVDFMTVKITLDSGDIIYGNECWWKPIKPDNLEGQEK